jgi:hypothetical protein
MTSKLYWKAVKIVSSGQPLPLYIAAKLLQHGYDVTAIERRYAA